MFTFVIHIAKNSLEKNIVRLNSGPYLLAGQNQFKSLWTRDFCFSVPALLSLGHHDVVKNHLSKLILLQRARDGLVPRVLDSISPQYRVALTSLRLPNLHIKDPLKAEYQDEHGSEAIDSNILVLLASFQYYRATQDKSWWDEYLPSLEPIFLYYHKHRLGREKLIIQSPYSDWQDSTNRTGCTFYTNILFAQLLHEAAELNVFQIQHTDADRFKTLVLNEFFWPEKKLWRAHLEHDALGLEAHLLALYWNLFSSDSLMIYKNLKSSELWQKSSRGTPGFNTSLHYNKNEKTLAVRLAGLENYHEDIYWSWLMGLSLLVAKQIGDTDEALKIQTEIESVLKRDQVVYEIYEPDHLLPFHSLLYKSEAPFSWGSAFIYLALK